MVSSPAGARQRAKRPYGNGRMRDMTPTGISEAPCWGGKTIDMDEPTSPRRLSDGPPNCIKSRTFELTFALEL